MNRLITLLVSFFFFSYSLEAQFSPALAQEGVIYGSTGTQDGARLVTINPQDGSISIIGNIQEFGTGNDISPVHSLAVSQDGRLFGMTSDYDRNTNLDRSANYLIQIDPASGQAIIIGPGSGTNQQNCLEFDSNGTLWSGEFFGNSSAPISQVNINTGELTPILTNHSIQWWTAMATDPTTGLIYATGYYDYRLYIIDPSGPSISLGPVLAGITNYPPGSMFFDADGNLFMTTGGNSTLGSTGIYSIDKSNGQISFIAPYSGITGSISGAAGIADIVPAAIPTLGQWGLIILGLGVLIFGVVAIRRRVFTLA